MVAILFIDAALIAIAFWVFWKYLGGKKLYQQITYDEATELHDKIDNIDERIAELPAEDNGSRTSPAVEFLRDELTRDRRRLETRLHHLDKE